MGMNIQKSAGVKADTFILKRNNMDRRIRMDVAMLIILAICTRLVAGIMNMERRLGMLIQDPVKDFLQSSIGKSWRGYGKRLF